MTRAARAVTLSLGSSLGDRVLMLRRAVQQIRRTCTVVRLSSVWETEPVDSIPGSPAFLNLIAILHTDLPVATLLEEMQQIERRLGRVRRERNAPRTIDIDLILAGAEICRNFSLTLPHPRYSERNFVLKPLQEVESGWCDPVSGTPIQQMTGRGRVERAGLLSDSRLR